MASTTPAARRAVNMLSDTVTQPTQAMRNVIAAAPVGDDVMGDDPSVNELQLYAAELLGKEEALYVPSGTMGNLIAVGVHCRRGEEMIVGDQAHMFLYECAGSSAYMGVGFRTVPNQSDGTILIEDIKNAIRHDDVHYPRTRLVTIENTHNICGGRVLPLEYIREVEALCKERNLKLHVDGARLANASVALNIPIAELVKGADSVSLCLSKGLGAPVGSVLAGTKEFIAEAKRLRKSLGGGMRQCGLMAAAGKYALESHFTRLAEDHTNAKALAIGLSSIPGIQVNVADVDSNIVFFSVTKDASLTTQALAAKLKESKGVLLVAGNWKGEKIRAVTNLHITADDIAHTVASIRELLA